jgi:hypothetical protein
MQNEWYDANTGNLAPSLAAAPAFSQHVAKARAGQQLGSANSKRCTFDFGSAREHDMLQPLFQHAHAPRDVFGYPFHVSYPQQKHLVGTFVFPGICFVAREAKSIFLCSFTFEANDNLVYTLMLRWTTKGPANVFDVVVHNALPTFLRDHEAMGETIPADILADLLRQLGHSALTAIESKRPPVAATPALLSEGERAKLIVGTHEAANRIPRNLIIDRGPPLPEEDEDSEAGSSVRPLPRRPPVPPKKAKRSRASSHAHESPVVSRRAKKSATAAAGPPAHASLQAATSLPAVPQQVRCIL